MSGSPETALIGRIRAGGREAFDEIVLAYQDRIMNAIFRMTGDHESALDMAQTTFVKAYQAMASFKGESAVYTWLYRIAVNTVLSERRKKPGPGDAKPVSLNRENADGDGRLSDSVPSAGCGPVDEVLSREEQAEVGRAIASLDDEFRIMVVLKDIEGLSYEEIAEITGCPRGTVKSRLHRARMMLKDRLKHLV
jgi:RNA polymerase sigma-70 factor (ECF subfamily)